MSTLAIKAQLLLLSHLKEISTILHLRGQAISRLTAGLPPHLNERGEVGIEAYSCGVELHIVGKQLQNYPHFQHRNSGCEYGAIGAGNGQIFQLHYIWVPGAEVTGHNVPVILTVRESSSITAIRRKSRVKFTMSSHFSNALVPQVINACTFLHAGVLSVAVDISRHTGGNGITMLELHPSFIHALESEGTLLLLVHQEDSVATLPISSREKYKLKSVNLEGLKLLLQREKDAEICSRISKFTNIFRCGALRFDEQGMQRLERDCLVEMGEVRSQLPTIFTAEYGRKYSLAVVKETAKKYGMEVREQLCPENGEVCVKTAWMVSYTLGVRSGRWCWMMREEKQILGAIAGSKRVLHFSDIDPRYCLLVEGKISSL